LPTWLNPLEADVADLNPVLLALLVGSIGGPVGGLVAAIVGFTIMRHVRSSLRGATLGLVGGFILSVIFLELVARGIDDAEGWMLILVPGGVIAGVGLRLLVLRATGASGNEDDGQPGYRRGQARKLAITLGAENMLEGLSIGVSFAVDFRLGVLVASLMIFDVFAEGLSITTELAEGDEGFGQMVLFAIAPTPLLGVGGAIGAFLGELSPVFMTGLFGAAAGIMLHAVIDDIIYDAQHLGSGAIITLPLIAGAVAGIVITAFV
jgi:zinc transporter, ZIP family